MKIAILLGSVRLGRQSHKAAWYLQKEIGKQGIETDLIDLAEDPLPIFRERINNNPEPPEKAIEIGRRLSKADAILMVTPEYHGSITGALKNAIDYYRDEFRKKPIGVVTTSTGAFGGINASTQLQHIILSVGGYPVPLKLLVPRIHQAFNDSFEPQNDAIIKSAGRFLNEFLWFADALYQKKLNQYKKEAV